MNDMRRLIGIVLLFLAASGLIAGTSYRVARSVCAHAMGRNTDDLTWLKDEFHLSDAELAHVRQLHEGYLPKCREMCAKIAAKNEELRLALETGRGVTPDAQRQLLELAVLRALCQTQMLTHFLDVSKAMPPDQGLRYWAQMQRLTLGFHAQVEENMSTPSAHGHQH